MSNIIEYSEVNWRLNYRYAVYTKNFKLESGETFSRSLIVIKNKYGSIVKFTNLHKYVVNYDKHTTRPLTSDIDHKLLYICVVLNDILINKYNKYRINHIFEITHDMLNSFFQDYAKGSGADGKNRKKQSITKCIDIVTSFFAKLSKQFGNRMALSIDELYRDTTYIDRYGNINSKRMPNFQVVLIESSSQIFRNLTVKVFNILLGLAIDHAPDIALAICIGGFSGLRPGETCNLRQINSPLGRGMTFRYHGSKLKSVEIDLTKKLALRSDNVNTGGIKRLRKQKIYPAFLPIFEKVYEMHMNLLKNRKIEPDFCPLFVNCRDKAMTYNDYNNKFKSLVMKHLCPKLLKSDDPELKIVGQHLLTNNLNPHSLRHFFSVQLVLNGEDIAAIQYWRGDRNPESAITYFRDKSDLIRIEKEMITNFFELNLDGAKEIRELHKM